MSDEVVPLYGQSTIQVPESKKSSDVVSKDRPVPVSPDLVAAQAYAKPKCWVCRTYDALPNTHYCKTHNNAYYRWLTCIGEGCTNVGERRVAGQTIYRCPEHPHAVPDTAGGANDKPVKTSRTQDSNSCGAHTPGAAGQTANAKGVRASSLKRPPNNIGHAY